MITSVRATAGYPTKLAALQDKTFTFGPGLTVLFGPNACGKSTLLKLCATYSSCGEDGWSAFSADYVRAKKKEQDGWEFPRRFALLRRGVAEADVVWDGTPTYIESGTRPHEQEAFERALATEDGMGEYMADNFSPRSAGQKSMVLLSRLRRRLDSPPNLLDEKGMFCPEESRVLHVDKVNDCWSTPLKALQAYVRSLPRTGPSTVLLDEPDMHLSIPNQRALWVQALPSLAKSFQVVAASHSLFALRAPGATIVDLVPGYAEECRKAFAMEGTAT